MGFEVSAVIAIFFVSFVVLGTSIYSTASYSQSIVDDASNVRYEMQNERLQTDITISNSSKTSGNESGYELSIMVTNTGSKTLQTDELDVLVDGIIESYTFSPSTKTWTPDETKTITVNNLSGTGVHRVKVVTGNGISDYDTYAV